MGFFPYYLNSLSAISLPFSFRIITKSFQIKLNIEVNLSVTRTFHILFFFNWSISFRTDQFYDRISAESNSTCSLQLRPLFLVVLGAADLVWQPFMGRLQTLFTGCVGTLLPSHQPVVPAKYEVVTPLRVETPPVEEWYNLDNDSLKMKMNNRIKNC